MTALPLQSIASPGVLRLALDPGLSTQDSAPSSPPHPITPSSPWVPIADAAPVLGVSEDSLRKRCTRDLAPRSLARLMPLPSGRRAWHLHRSVDPRLVRMDSPAALARMSGGVESLHAATNARRDRAMMKAAIVRRFRAWRESPATHTLRDFPIFAALVLAEFGEPVTRSRVYAWSNAAPATDDPSLIAAALLDRRGAGGPSGGVGQAFEPASISPEAWRSFEALYLHSHRRLNQCWRMVRDLAAAHGWSWPSLGTVRRRADRELPPLVRDFAKQGAERWAKSHETPVEQDPDRHAAGEVWESDHSIFDCSVRVFDPRSRAWRAERPWITAWFDWRSRRLCGWHISMEHNSSTIGLALRHALLDEKCGVPRLAKLDNGRDYQSRALHGEPRAAARRRNPVGQAFSLPGVIAESHETDAQIAERRHLQQGLLQRLGVEVSFALPYNHNGKARIERFFGVMHEWFCREHASWCGGKPEDRDRRELRAVVKDVMSLPTLDDLRESFARFAARYNTEADRAIPDLAGLSPLDFYERFLPARRTTDEFILDEVTLRRGEPRLVTKRGVSLTIGGAVFRYGAGVPLLMALVGTGTRVIASYHPDRVDRVRVWKVLPDGREEFICIAQQNERMGECSEEALKHALADRRRVRRQIRQRVDVSRVLLSPVESAALDAADHRAALERERILSEPGGTGVPPVLRLSPGGAGFQPASGGAGFQPASGGAGFQPASGGAGFQPASGGAGFQPASLADARRAALADAVAPDDDDPLPAGLGCFDPEDRDDDETGISPLAFAADDAEEEDGRLDFIGDDDEEDPSSVLERLMS